MGTDLWHLANNGVASYTTEELRAELERRERQHKDEALTEAVEAVTAYMDAGFSASLLFKELAKTNHFFQPQYDQLEAT